MKSRGVRGLSWAGGLCGMCRCCLGGVLGGGWGPSHCGGNASTPGTCWERVSRCPVHFPPSALPLPSVKLCFRFPVARARTTAACALRFHARPLCSGGCCEDERVQLDTAGHPSSHPAQQQRVPRSPPNPRHLNTLCQTSTPASLRSGGTQCGCARGCVCVLRGLLS